MQIVDTVTSAVGDAVKGVKKKLSEIQGRKLRHGIFSNDGSTNLLIDMGILSASITNDSSIASHPLDINTKIQENIVVEPKTATVLVAGETRHMDELYSILTQLKNDHTLVSVMVDRVLYPNMVIKTIPVQRDPEKYDILEVPLVLHEFIFSVSKTSKMSDPQNVELAEYSTRQKAGLQKPVSVSGQDYISSEGGKTRA